MLSHRKPDVIYFRLTNYQSNFRVNVMGNQNPVFESTLYQRLDKPDALCVAWKDNVFLQLPIGIFDSKKIVFQIHSGVILRKLQRIRIRQNRS